MKRFHPCQINDPTKYSDDKAYRTESACGEEKHESDKAVCNAHLIARRGERTDRCDCKVQNDLMREKSDLHRHFAYH